MNALLPSDEAARQRALELYEVLDTPSSPEFDRLTALAARLFDVPIALVTLLDRDRQWFKSCYGVDLRQTPRSMSFCNYTVLSAAVLVVPDTMQDVRFCSNPLVTGEQHIRFYAGAPLFSEDGHALGSLCVLDTQARGFDAKSQSILQDLAACIVDELELHRSRLHHQRTAQQLEQVNTELAQTNRDLAQANDNLQRVNRRAQETNAQLEESKSRLQMALDAGHMGVWERDLTSHATIWSSQLETIYGLDTGTFEGTFEAFLRRVHPDDRERVRAHMSAENLKALGRVQCQHAPSGTKDVEAGSAKPCHAEHATPQADFLCGAGSLQPPPAPIPRLDAFRIVLPSGDTRWLEAHCQVRCDEEEASRVVGLAMDITERKNAESRLRDSEKRFRNAFTHSSVGMSLVSPEGRWLHTNSRMSEIIGYTEDELRKLTFQELTHPDDLEINVALRERVFHGKSESYRLEKRYRHKDGHWVWGALDAGLVRDEEGNPSYFIVQVQDITARKEAQEQLATSMRRVTRTLESITDAFFSLDYDWRFTYINAQAARTMRRTSEQLLGQNFWEAYPHLYNSEFGRQYRHAVETGKAVTFVSYYPQLQDWYEVHAYPSEDGLSVYFQDVTERQEAETALRESEARFGRMVANVPGIVCHYVRHRDGTYSFPFISERCRDMFEYEPHEIQAHPELLARSIHPDDLMSFADALFESSASLTPWSWEGRIIVPSGKEKWLQGSARSKLEANGDISWDALLLDVTERKRAELELTVAKRDAELLREAAESANLAKSEFLSRISHELRTPLNAIIGFAQMLQEDAQDGLLTSDQASMTNDIHDAGQHLLNLINELLDLARIEQGYLTLVMEPICVNDVLRDVLSLIAPIASRSSISLEDRSIASQEQWMLADRQRVSQVLLNLLSNAVKYNREHGRVSVKSALCGDRVRISVSDEGAGLLPEEVALLFAPFERLSAGRSEVEGTGLGLSLSKNLLEAMDGTIGVESMPGQGSTFWCELPRTRPNTSQELHRETSPELAEAETPDLLAILNSLSVGDHAASHENGNQGSMQENMGDGSRLA